MVCPRCSEFAHRSRLYGLQEKIVSRLTSYRPYRCHECGWRGWRAKGRSSNQRIKLQVIIGSIALVVMTALISLYFSFNRGA